MRIGKENPKNPKSEIRNPQSEITGRMLFARNALPSGPQACFFAEKAIAKAKGGKQAIKKSPSFDIENRRA